MLGPGQQRFARIYIVSLLVLVFSLIRCSHQSTPINIVGVFEPTEGSQPDDLGTEEIFSKALDYVIYDRYLGYNKSLAGYTFNATEHDGFLLSQYINEIILHQKIVALIGAQSKSLRDFMYVMSTEKSIPYLELMPSFDYSREMVLQMHPTPNELIHLVSKLVDRWSWTNVLFVYENDEDLPAFMDFVTMYGMNGLNIKFKQLNRFTAYTETFRYLHKLKIYHVIVSCSLQTIIPFLNKALEMQMLTEKYHYHFTSLDVHILNLTHYSYGGANITWNQLVYRTGRERNQKSDGVHEYEAFLGVKGSHNPSPQYFSTYNALMVDAITILAKAITKLIRNTLFAQNGNNLWGRGFMLHNLLKTEVESRGITGHIQFNPIRGTRMNYTIHMMKLKEGGLLLRTGYYNPSIGMKLIPDPEADDNDNDEDYRNRVLKVSSKLSDPFVMKKANHEKLTGNDKYEGFAIDLMKRIAVILNIRYTISESDGFGTRQANNEFDGMVGEVVNKTADIALSSLTINHDREQAIDFTKPFMTFGISILYKRPAKEPPHILSFMEPIKIEVWGTIIISVVVVSFSLHVFSRFSPTEWESPFPCNEEYEFMENQFNLSNAFWFSVGSIMQQGCDIMPKAPSTRIVAIAWWLFTLIIISSYTANLAAFLTITTLSETFKNADELAYKSNVPYGCKRGGNTCSFFQNSKIPVYQKMWEHMSTTAGVLVDETADGINKVKEEDYAFLMESPSLQYQTVTDKACQLAQVGPVLNSLSYGIGVRSKSPLRDDLSSAILKLNEDQVLLELYNKWWKVDDNRCKAEGDGSTDLTLKLKNLEGIFVFLMGGLVIGCIMLCIEILGFTVHKSREEKRPFCKVLAIWIRSSMKGRFPNPTSTESLEDTQSNNARNNTKNSLKDNVTQDELEPLNNGHIGGRPRRPTADTYM